MMTFLNGAIHGLVPLAVAAALALARWLAPPAAHREYRDEELEEFSKRHRWLDLAAMLLYFLILYPVISVGWFALLVGIGRHYDSTMPPHLLLVRLQPEWLVWGLPTMFLGMVSSGWALAICFRLWFGTEFCRLMQAAGDRKANLNSVKVFRWLSVGFVTVSTTLVILELNWYTRFEENQIVIKPLFSFHESAYSYNRIRDLVEPTHLIAPNGRLVERTRQFVLFDDGEQWCHDGLLRDAGPLIELLKSKTGKTFRQVRFIEDAIK
jgi:hypothetical protein